MQARVEADEAETRRNQQEMSESIAAQEQALKKDVGTI